MNPQKYLGNYEIEAALGSNVYFESYRAVDAVRKRPVIIKTLKPESMRDRKSTHRFLDQARLASELVHPHLAWIWEAGEIDGQCFLVERFVEGPTLRQILSKEGNLPTEHAHTLISQISRGLDFAHSRGFAHGNVRPENILINPDLGAILTDLGPSTALQAITPHWANVVDIGMAPYTAPEIWKGHPPSAESDQYSLACIFAEMLSGEKTFGAPTLSAIKEKHLSAFQAPLSWAVSIPWPTAKAILRALEPESSKRFQSMEAFSQAPQSIVAEINLDPQLKKESENQVKAWEAAQQQARQEAEEAIRLGALEKARREIDEELQRQEFNQEVHLPIPPENISAEAPDEPLDESPRATHRSKSRPRTARASMMRKGWLWIAFLGILVVLAALWLANSFSINNNLATVTPTQTALTASDIPTLSSSPTSEATVTPSATFTKTATRTKSSTTTKTPTTTLTNTITPTASLTITPTRTPKDEDTSIFGSPLTKPLLQTANP